MSKEAQPDRYAAQRARLEALYASQERQVADLNPNVKTHREALKQAKKQAVAHVPPSAVAPVQGPPPGFGQKASRNSAKEEEEEEERREPPVFDTQQHLDVQPVECMLGMPWHCPSYYNHGHCVAGASCPFPMHVMTLASVGQFDRDL
jgi:ribosomal protein L12E/L44/L45/RPP1/RPP2